MRRNDAPRTAARKAPSSRVKVAHPQRRAAEWLEPALLAMLDTLPAAAMIVDRLGNVILANQPGRDLAAELEASELAGFVEAASAGASGLFAVTRLVPGPGPVLVMKRPSLDELIEHGVRPFGLSKAQTRVLALVARGMGNREVASLLFISERTVEAHVTAILTKLCVDSRAAAVAAALGNPEAVPTGSGRSEAPASAPPAPASRPRRTA